MKFHPYDGMPSGESVHPLPMPEEIHSRLGLRTGNGVRKHNLRVNSPDSVVVLAVIPVCVSLCCSPALVLLLVTPTCRGVAARGIYQRFQLLRLFDRRT